VWWFHESTLGVNMARNEGRKQFCVEKGPTVPEVALVFDDLAV
jgi:hypothetical protein